MEHFFAIIHKTVTVTLHKASCINQIGAIFMKLD